MIFDKIFNINQQNGGALKPAALSDGGGPTNGGTLSNGTTIRDQTAADARLEITNVWSGPIIILSSDNQAELEKHYLSYSSTIPAESFEAIFREKTLVET